ncbi:o-succinylbenzoate synthase [Gloeocapsa sp. PCC 73106]|uniref:o-succinylbenzoate synthase n=1 Tax=Gloeocapsa sp. PCC 73106 TaxID=102232 RepID=UPI000550AB64|nr:o-succinylbenzoate synthase [Gloeocapsa sp. PCC 73106]
MSKITFSFATYQRPFVTPLVTHHGTWEVRSGIIIRIADDEGRVGWGEIAPLSWFGSETLAQAIAFCQEIEKKSLTEAVIKEIPSHLTACQFGFECALEDLYHHPTVAEDSLDYSYLLPAGKEALRACQQERRTTFKWKIGVKPLEEELEIFTQLVPLLQGAKVRLDANGGLSLAKAIAWLKIADETGVVEFLEQPLPPAQFQEMLELSREYQTAIALDESVATLTQLEACYHNQWRGIYVIKPAIAGSPQKLRRLCRELKLDLVFSSVFESKIGRQAVLNLARELGTQRALGFSINHWFKEI